MDDFQYFSPAIENREKFIIDEDDDEGNDAAQSDLVKLALNMSFMAETEATTFQFDKESFIR
jgi:hypothetical protein